MCAVLAIYGKEDILAYVRGALDDKEEQQEIESLVKSDLRAADVVENIQADDIGDDGTFDIEAFRRLRKLREIANKVGARS
ncbi:hypothetical protein [Thalassospira lohafexi]|uniref:Uncharacterized protein n=1 Tax=Thalassospira lohafexi TaxID=744227 RepID=A0A2N3L5J8_9PROT|nr:hypothetical protein [Thalassospira lohafexi]PKR58082.1 hypothetical protein COO92_09970 [Thalassospira lohafexi]